MIVYALSRGDGVLLNLLPSSVLEDSGEDAARWIQLDEGEGPRYEQPQQQYLPLGLWDANGALNYKLVEGAVAERTEAEKAAEPAPEPRKSYSELEQELNQYREGYNIITGGE